MPFVIDDLIIAATVAAASAGTSAAISKSASGKAGKEARRQADIASQGAQVQAIGDTFVRQIAGLDPGAPELSAYIGFVNQKVATVESPEDEQAQTNQEGQRILRVVAERVRRDQEAALAQAKTLEEARLIAERQRLQDEADERAFERNLRFQGLQIETAAQERAFMLASRQAEQEFSFREKELELQSSRLASATLAPPDNFPTIQGRERVSTVQTERQPAIPPALVIAGAAAAALLLRR